MRNEYAANLALAATRNAWHAERWHAHQVQRRDRNARAWCIAILAALPAVLFIAGSL